VWWSQAEEHGCCPWLVELERVKRLDSGLKRGEYGCARKVSPRSCIT